MPKKIFLILLLSVNFTVVNLFSQDLPKAGAKYSKNLDNVISKISKDQFVSLNKVEMSIPTTIGEYFTYYDYTSSERDVKIVQSFYKLDSMIYKNAEENRLRFSKKVIFMADFVDGEYAEPYYEYLQKIVQKNKKCFCESYLKLSENSRIRLEELYSENCKK